MPRTNVGPLAEVVFPINHRTGFAQLLRQPSNPSALRPTSASDPAVVIILVRGVDVVLDLASESRAAARALPSLSALSKPPQSPARRDFTSITAIHCRPAFVRRIDPRQIFLLQSPGGVLSRLHPFLQLCDSNFFQIKRRDFRQTRWPLASLRDFHSHDGALPHAAKPPTRLLCKKTLRPFSFFNVWLLWNSRPNGKRLIRQTWRNRT